MSNRPFSRAVMVVLCCRQRDCRVSREGLGSRKDRNWVL